MREIKIIRQEIERIEKQLKVKQDRILTFELEVLKYWFSVGKSFVRFESGCNNLLFASFI